MTSPGSARPTGPATPPPACKLLPQAVHQARGQELTWAQIGELLGTTAATAPRRHRRKP